MDRTAKLFAAITVSLLALTAEASAEQTGARDQIAASAVARLSGLQEVDGRQLLNGEPFTGIVMDNYPDGARKARFQLVDGRANGVWVEWHPDGAIRFYSEWRDGAGEGPFVYFHPNGEISERVTARGDRWEGLAEGRLPNGRKAFERVYRGGKLISEKRLSIDGKE